MLWTDERIARITAEGAVAPKEGRLFIDGGIHARELPSVELMLVMSMGHIPGGPGGAAHTTTMLVGVSITSSLQKASPGT